MQNIFSRKQTFIVTAAAAILMEASYAAFAVWGSGNIPFYMFIYFEAFILFFASGFILRRSRVQNDKRFLYLIITAGLLFRATLIPAELTTSPDAYRYLWEGKVILNGYNPYLTAPADSALAHLHEGEFPVNINFNHMPAIYPPFAQTVFTAAYIISGLDFLGLKLLYLLLEALSFIIIVKLLKYKSKDTNLLLYYAWCPLPVMEFFINAHLDVIGIPMVLMFILFAEKNKIVMSAVPLTLAFLTKFYPIVLFPLLLRKGGVKKSIAAGGVVILITAIFYLPFIYKNSDILQFLLKYISHWEFNGSVYNLFKLLTNGETAKIMCAGLLLAGTGLIWIYYKDFTAAAYGIFLLLIVTAATVYPWYLGWLNALNPLMLFTSAGSLFFTINFSNFTPLGSEWREYTAVMLIQYIPFYILLTLDLIKYFRNR